MRVNCAQKALVKGLSVVNRAVSTRSTMPILGNILVEAKNNLLRLASTNLELGIQCWLEADVEQEGIITVPAKLLTDFVKGLPDESVTLSVKDTTDTLHVRCARMDAKIKGLNADDFPAMPDIPQVEGMLEMEDVKPALRIKVDTLAFSRMIDQVSFAASSDTFRPALSGILTRWENNNLYMAATDGYRLCVRSESFTEDNPVSEPFSIIIPAKSLSEVSKISAESDRTQPLQFFMQDKEQNHILFGMYGDNNPLQRIVVSMQLIGAQFPSYQAIIPSTHKTRTAVNTTEFLKAVRVASLFSKDNANIIYIKIGAQNETGAAMQILSKDTEQGNTTNDLEADVEGPEIDIAFNAQYLLDMLSHVLEEEIVIETTEKTRPCSIYPSGTSKDKFLYVVMPMHQK